MNFDASYSQINDNKCALNEKTQRKKALKMKRPAFLIGMQMDRCLSFYTRFLK